MSQILSQNEVDALLSAVTEGELSAVEQTVEAVDEKAGYRPYDLTSKDRIFRGKMPLLDLINDKFSRALRTTLNLNLRKAVGVEVEPTRLIKYGEFLNSLPLPTCINIFSMNPLRGSGLFILESRFVYILIDLFCGGSAVSKYRVEGREFTSIELRLVQRIVQNGLRDLEKAWETVYPLDVELVRTEINPQFVSIAPTDDVVVVITLTVDVEDSTGKIQVVVPYASLEPIKEKLQGGFVRNIEDSDNVWHDHLRESVRAARVETTTVFGRTAVTIRELLALKTGDVLQLDKYADEDIHVLVEGRPKYRGVVGVSRGYRAVQLTHHS
jgi:flagellar motor switch protein FliM